MPGQELRHPRGPRLHRRHLGSVSLSRHPLRLRHVHAGLFVQAVDRAEGDRRRAADPELRPRDRRRERHRQEDPLPSSRQARVVVVAGVRAGPWKPSAAGRAKRRRRSCASPAISCSCARAITNTRTAITPEFPGAAEFRRPHRASAEMARRSRLCGQARGGDRLGRHRGDAGAGDGEDRPRMSPCCSARRPMWWRGRRRIRSPTNCAQTAAETRLSSDPLAQRAVRHVFLPALPAQAGARVKN